MLQYAGWRGLTDVLATAVRWRCHEALPDLVPYTLRDDRERWHSGDPA